MSRVDLGRVLELHEEATRRRELVQCKGDGERDCVLVDDHRGDHLPYSGRDESDTIRLQLVRDQRDRHASVVAMVPSLVERLELLQKLLTESCTIAAEYIDLGIPDEDCNQARFRIADIRKAAGIECPDCDGTKYVEIDEHMNDGPPRRSRWACWCNEVGR